MSKNIQHFLYKVPFRLFFQFVFCECRDNEFPAAPKQIPSSRAAGGDRLVGGKRGAAAVLIEPDVELVVPVDLAGVMGVRPTSPPPLSRITSAPSAVTVWPTWTRTTP
jgi:hypothetical protein